MANARPTPFKCHESTAMAVARCEIVIDLWPAFIFFDAGLIIQYLRIGNSFCFNSTRFQRAFFRNTTYPCYKV